MRKLGTIIDSHVKDIEKYAIKRWGHLACLCFTRPLFLKTSKKFYHLAKLYETYRNLDPVCFSGTLYNLWAPNAEFHSFTVIYK